MKLLAGNEWFMLPHTFLTHQIFYWELATGTLLLRVPFLGVMIFMMLYADLYYLNNSWMLNLLTLQLYTEI